MRGTKGSGLMRAGVTMALVASAIVATGLGASVARANGGAYIEFEGTHHLPGDQVIGSVYVSVPTQQRDLLAGGPFYAYLLPGGGVIDQGGPLPVGAIRVGEFAVMDEGNETELRVSFIVPDVQGDYYGVGLCNEPCTISGFGETVSGTVSIAATAREAMLLTDNAKLHASLNRLQRDVRRSEREAEHRASIASAEMAEVETARQELAAEVSDVRHELAIARDEAARLRIDPWVAAVAVTAAAVGSWSVARRRRVAPPAVSGEGEAVHVP